MRWKRNVFLMLGYSFCRRADRFQTENRAAGWIVDNSDANSGNSGFRAESGTAAG